MSSSIKTSQRNTSRSSIYSAYLTTKRGHMRSQFKVYEQPGCSSRSTCMKGCTQHKITHIHCHVKRTIANNKVEGVNVPAGMDTSSVYACVQLVFLQLVFKLRWLFLNRVPGSPIAFAVLESRLPFSKLRSEFSNCVCKL